MIKRYSDTDGQRGSAEARLLRSTPLLIVAGAAPLTVKTLLCCALLALLAGLLPAAVRANLNLSPEQRLLVIRTLTARQDGRVFENRGSGVIVGPYYLTVYHNLDPRLQAHQHGGSRGRSYLGNLPVEPIYADPASDVAILPLPAALCAESCSGTAFATQVLPRLDQPVRWYLGTADSPSGAVGWRSGRILSRTLDTALQRRRSATGYSVLEEDFCAAGLVYEVDAPFYPGSSGMAIWDDKDTLLGIAQGSYERADGRVTGYFRPWYCIQQHWPGELRVRNQP